MTTGSGVVRNTIVLTAAPMGRFLEGKISGAALPGTIMQVKAGVELDATGRNTYEPYNRSADGKRGMIIILRERQGPRPGGVDDAYADGERCFMYCPLMGDEVQVRVAAPGTGTDDTIAVGDEFMVNDGDGLCIDVSGSEESAPFKAFDSVDDVEAEGTLVPCFYTGY